MRLLKNLTIVGCLAALGACAEQALKPAEIGPNVAIVAPAEDVPQDYAAFSGLWTGTWGARLDGKLAVQTVDADGAVKGVYAWGDHPKGRFSAGSTPVQGKIAGKVMTLNTFTNGAKVSYTMRGDGALEGAYDLNGEVSKGIFGKK